MTDKKGPASPDAHEPHEDLSIAYHVPWGFATRAYLEPRDPASSGDMKPPFLNVYPLAAELRKWMLRQPGSLPMPEATWWPGFNLYSRHASVLIAQYLHVTNDGAAFSDGPKPPNSYKAELRRIRLFSEFLLYTTRISEGLIKQLLFCTSFPEAWYRKATLGSLLSQWCRRCPPAGKPPHRLSMLGSLGHPYGLCHSFEKCLEHDLLWLKQLRDTHSAHAATWEIRLSKPPEESQRRLKRESLTLGERFLHMLQHIADVESRMIEELQRLAAEYPLGRPGSNLIATFQFQSRVRRLVQLLRLQAARRKAAEKHRKRTRLRGLRSGQPSAPRKEWRSPPLR